MIAARSPESPARIAARAQELRREIALMSLRHELNMSQTQLARAMGLINRQWRKLNKRIMIPGYPL